MTKVKTGWETEDPSLFLKVLGYTSHARNWCREEIKRHAKEGATSLLEVGVGGLNERKALNEFIFENPEFKYIGTDATQCFLDHGKELFPDDEWKLLDISRHVEIGADILYSQHVLEHVPGLNPALVNMLNMTGKVLYNIFFMSPSWTEELINWSQYPRYHNTYCCQHIVRVCETMGFDAVFKVFDNTEFLLTPRRPTDPPIPKIETVLIATRREQ